MFELLIVRDSVLLGLPVALLSAEPKHAVVASELELGLGLGGLGLELEYAPEAGAHVVLVLKLVAPAVSREPD